MDAAIAIGNSNDVDGYDAAAAAATAARDELGPEGADFIFVFSTIGYEQEDVLEGVRDILGDRPMGGATFEGIIGRNIADETMYAVQVVAIRSKTIKFHELSAEDVVGNPLQAGISIGQAVQSVNDPGNRVLFLFPDFRSNISQLFEGIERHCNIPFVGGVSGDNLKFQQCYQFLDGTVREKACSAVLMVGDFELETIVTHGSEPVGDKRSVTKSRGNTIFEIDGRPALDVASEEMGAPINADNIATAITLMGIGFRADDLDNAFSPYVLRAIHAIDFETRSCSVPVDVPEGTEIQFMRRDHDGVLMSATLAAKHLKRSLDDQSVDARLVCQFDCAGRGKVMIGDDVLKGVKMVQDTFAEPLPWMGTFSLGEISPVDRKNYFHNFTATLAVFH
jgi:hypothetical protein